MGRVHVFSIATDAAKIDKGMTTILQQVQQICLPEATKNEVPSMSISRVPGTSRTTAS